MQKSVIWGKKDMELIVKGIRKKYGTKVALDGFDAVFTPGIYGLLGPNGAGKSTLMNLIAGNIQQDEGIILYNGQDIRVLGKQFRAVLGYMPQQQNVYDDFTALLFMQYMAALKGMKKSDAKMDIPALLQMVGLYEERHKKLKTYSGGMKQRVLIAQAMLNNPQVIILDEPTAGLDPRQRIALRNLISELGADKIILVATHVVSDIESIAKEIVLIKDGGILKQDTVVELKKDMPNLEEVYLHYFQEKVGF